MFECTAMFVIDHLATVDCLSTFDQRYDLLNQIAVSGYQFRDDDQPESWIQRLLIMPDANPELIAHFIKTVFGYTMICKDKSLIYEYDVTIADALGEFLDAIQDCGIEFRDTVEQNIIKVIRIINQTD